MMMVLTALAAGGAGLAVYAGLGEKTQPGQGAKARAAAAQQAAEPTKHEVPVVDQYCDPLPEGAVARLGAARFRHEGLAHEMVFTPDGKTLLGITGSGLILWDAATGKELRRPEPRALGIPNGMAAVGGMAVSPDGKILAIIVRSFPQGPFPLIQSGVTLWDLTAGKKLRTHSLPKVTKGPGGLIAHPNRLFFTPDGNALICLAGYRPDDRKAVVLDLTSGEVRISLGDGEPFGRAIYAEERSRRL